MADEQLQQVNLTDAHGELSETVVLRPGEETMADVQARKAAFDEAWESHRATTGQDPTRGKDAFFAEWITTYEGGK